MNLKIWTPAYAVNRVRYFFFEKQNPDKPWITQDAIQILDRMICEDDLGVEFGSGRSTVWYAERAKHLISIEDHSEWYETVKKQFQEAEISNVDYRLKSAEGNNPAATDYCKLITEFEDNSLDFIIVDGKHRDVLALEAVAKIKQGGFIVLDDCQRYLPYKTTSPYRIGTDRSKMTEAWRSFENQMKQWRMIWTTNGVSDTAIFIKK